MKMIDLFCGSKSMAKAFEKYKYETLTIDYIKEFNPDICVDILDLSCLPYCDILWMSPPCTTFSVASIGCHWKADYTPKTRQAEIGLKILDKSISFLEYFEGTWYIENPRGMMRKVITKIFEKYHIDCIRQTVTYCQYGDTRMKPTDIWTNNFEWKPKPMCKNGDSCHESAPRGSKTGTQGLKNAFERSRIPDDFCEEIAIEGAYEAK